MRYHPVRRAGTSAKRTARHGCEWVPMQHQLAEWLVRYGAPMLFVAQGFGIFGVPIPDELLLTMAGAFVAKGVLHGSSTLTAAVAGCLTGITLSYALGRVVGIKVLRATFARHLDHLERAQALFRRFGGWLLAFGYFIPGVRHVTAIAAGSGCMSYRTFAGYAYPGGVLWCTVFLALGFYAGDRFEAAAGAARTHLATSAGVLAVAAIAYAVVHHALRRSQDA